MMNVETKEVFVSDPVQTCILALQAPRLKVNFKTLTTSEPLGLVM
jgi:hypothetical protein